MFKWGTPYGEKLLAVEEVEEVEASRHGDAEHEHQSDREQQDRGRHDSDSVWRMLERSRDAEKEED